MQSEPRTPTYVHTRRVLNPHTFPLSPPRPSRASSSPSTERLASPRRVRARAPGLSSSFNVALELRAHHARLPSNGHPPIAIGRACGPPTDGCGDGRGEPSEGGGGMRTRRGPIDGAGVRAAGARGRRGEALAAGCSGCCRCRRRCRGAACRARRATCRLDCGADRVVGASALVRELGGTGHGRTEGGGGSACGRRAARGHGACERLAVMVVAGGRHAGAGDGQRAPVRRGGSCSGTFDGRPIGR